MKILYVIIHGDVLKGGGSNVAIKNTLQALWADGSTEICAVTGSEGDLTAWMDSVGIRHYLCPSLGAFASRVLPGGLRHTLTWPLRRILASHRQKTAVRDICTIIDREHPDLVHSNNSIVNAGFLAARKKGIPHIWHLREYPELIRGIPPGEARQKELMSLSATVSVSPGVAEAWGRVNADRDFVVPDGVMSSSEAVYLPEKEDHFLYVGSLHPMKGLDDLLTAYADFCRKGGHTGLRIAGTGSASYTRHLEERLEREGLSGKVSLLGFRPDRHALMARAKALVIPSRSEGFGMTAAEAMMNGCLVIGRDIGGISYILGSAPGCEITFRTEEELTDRMLEVEANGPSYYKKAVLEAKETACGKFSTESSSEQLKAIYKRLS